MNFLIIALMSDNDKSALTTGYFISDNKVLDYAQWLYVNFPPPEKIVIALIICAGLYMIGRFYQMAKYQFLYGGDYGIRHLKGDLSKEEKQELRSNFSWKRRLKL
jgi:hypothetical protein